VAQKRGTKILQVPNPADPLKSCNGEKAYKRLVLDVVVLCTKLSIIKLPLAIVRILVG
jgi:hypothetical protein